MISAARMICAARLFAYGIHMAIRRDEVVHVAKLARLHLTEEELARFQNDLGQILEHADQLQTVDTAHIEPLEYVAAAQMPLRPDEVRPGTDAVAALSGAPRELQGGFAVPAFVDD